MLDKVYLTKRINSLLLLLTLVSSTLFSLFLFAVPASADVNNPVVTINSDYDLSADEVKIVQIATLREYPDPGEGSFESLGDGAYRLNGITLAANDRATDTANDYKAVVTIDGKSAESAIISLVGREDVDFGVNVDGIVPEDATVSVSPGSITALIDTPVGGGDTSLTQNQNLILNGDENQVVSLQGTSTTQTTIVIDNLEPGSYNLVFEWDISGNPNPSDDSTNLYQANGVVVESGEVTQLGTITKIPPGEELDEVEVPEEEEAVEDETCESAGGAFNFIVCPALDFADGAIAKLDERILDALYIGESNYNDDDLRESWARIRNVAYVLLIPIMLIMVISTALGFSFVDAYTVKRAIPRMFIAIIFMALSFDICVLAIEIVNAVGQGIAGLIANPFGGISGKELSLGGIFSEVGGVGGGAAGGLVIAGAIGFVAVGYVGIGILVSYMFVAALILLAIFVLLALRRVLVVALILLAPLAILSWIFPGNDKLWKLWYNSFSKLLYLFPIIIGLLATGRVFASIADDSTSGIFGIIIKLTAFVGPYFLIPTAFKFAGGVFGNIAGMANDRSKGVFDRQRKYRGEKRQATKKDALEGNRFKNTPGLRRLNNTVGKGMAAPGAGLSAFRKGGIGAQYAKNTGGAAKEFGEKNVDYNAFNADDDVLAASLGETESAIEAKLKTLDRFKVDPEDKNSKYDSRNDAEVAQNLQMIMQAKRAAGSKTYKKAAIQDLAKAGTYFEDAGHLAEMVNEVYGNDRAGAGAAMIAARGASMSAGRVDIGGAGAGVTLGALGSQYNATKNLGKADNLATYADARSTAATQVKKGVIKSQGAQALAHSSMKEKAVKALMPELVDRLDTVHGENGADSPEYKRELASIANLYDTMSQTSSQNADVVADTILSKDLFGTGQNIQQQIEANRKDSTFVQYRREYAQEQNDPNNPNIRPQGKPGDSAGGGFSGSLG